MKTIKPQYKYKKRGNQGLFDKQESLEKLNSMGNILQRLSEVLDFEIFRKSLEDALLNQNKKSNAGAKPYDVVMMFKILLVQRIFGLSDAQIEFQIIDRLTFKDFLGLESGDKIPDEKTIWSFRETITKNSLVEVVFQEFNSLLEKKGLLINEGKMIDASFTTAPKQRNTKEENQTIKAGKGEELWKDKPKKKRQKDVDARWTKKNNQNYFGYKNHTKVDTKSKFIEAYVVTSASVHDSQVLEDLLSEKDQEQELHADSAYSGEKQEKVIAKYKMKNCVNEKGNRHSPLDEKQKESNREKSKVRARVEHVYGFIKQNMSGLSIKSIGIRRAKGVIGLINLTYNLARYEQVIRLGLLPIKNQ